jgi:hypothetical protein
MRTLIESASCIDEAVSIAIRKALTTASGRHSEVSYLHAEGHWFDPSTVLHEIAERTLYATLDVFGPTVEFVSGPDDPAAGF